MKTGTVLKSFQRAMYLQTSKNEIAGWRLQNGFQKTTSEIDMTCFSKAILIYFPDNIRFSHRYFRSLQK